MALQSNFPKSPFEILDPDVRWYPGDEAMEKDAHKLVPPLVHNLRREVKAWRDKGYEGATETSKSLLKFWFETEHPLPKSDGTVVPFQYYFAQREALETIVYLNDITKVQGKYDLMRFDSTEQLQADMFDEEWPRYVVKMATGAGKTKVLALTLVWSYFHKLYEPGSNLARNFLVIAPNIIVLDRIKADFQGLKVFFQDPMIPDNGVDGHNWHDDFQLTLHIQDEARVTHPTGNIFLTNIHRVYESRDVNPSFADEDTTNYFLGARPVGKTNESKVDLAMIVREIDELVVLNDEAHHIHDPKLAWFKSIQDIHNRLLQKGGRLPLQIDVTATPKKTNGAIFPQTICDYPLVEAIYQNVVKHPVLPDQASRAKLEEKPSALFVEKYADFLALGVEEWRKVYVEQLKNQKKAVLFVMVDDTVNCDDVAKHLEATYPELRNGVLTIHTNRSGEVSESVSGTAKELLDQLRGDANRIDSLESPYKAIVSVLMLKEGWDVQNVTTIVGLRAYSSKSNILPEQTLGRGLRRMYRGTDIEEEVSVIGTPAFMEFVESIKSEGVELEYQRMGRGTLPKAPPVITVDNEDATKDIEKLDIEVPILSPRIYREYKNISQLDLEKFSFKPVEVKQFSEEQQKEIVFRGIVDESKTHTTVLPTVSIGDPTSAVGFFAQAIKKELRLVGGYDELYAKVKEFIRDRLFGQTIDLADRNILRNLSEQEARRTIIEEFKKQINELTVTDRGEAQIQNYIKLSQTKSFVITPHEMIIPRKSVFNRVFGDSHFELEFASFLEKCDDVVSYAKNYLAIGFKLDYQNAKGEIKDYFPDFFVKTAPNEVWIVELKGFEDIDVEPKHKRLQQWVEDVNREQSRIGVHELFVSQEHFGKYYPTTFKQLISVFVNLKN